MFSSSLRTTRGVCSSGLLLLSMYAFCFGQAQDRFVKVLFSNGKGVMAELAVSNEDRARGLMFREKIMPDQGMLFIFEREDLHAFWMKNTLIPLDILWLDRDKHIVHIEENLPPCRKDPCPSFAPSRPALYVLELKAGSVEAFGLKLDDPVVFLLPAWVKS